MDLEASMNGLYKKMTNNAKEADYNSKTLKEELERMQVSYRQKKSQMNNHREKEYERLTRVTLLSNEAIKKLTSVKEQGDKILSAAEMCRRMETEEKSYSAFGNECFWKNSFLPKKSFFAPKKVFCSKNGVLPEKGFFCPKKRRFLPQKGFFFPKVVF